MKSHISNYELYSLRCEIMKHFLCNMYVDLVYQLEMLVHDKLRPCALDLHFFDVFWISFEYFKSGSTKVNRIWNIQKILKKHQKNANPVHMALVYHVLTSPRVWDHLEKVEKMTGLEMGLSGLPFEPYFMYLLHENCFGDVVSHTMAHICAEYGNFITNYDTIMAILMPTWPCQDRALKVFDSSLTAPLARDSRRTPLSCVKTYPLERSANTEHDKVDWEVELDQFFTKTR